MTASQYLVVTGALAELLGVLMIAGPAVVEAATTKPQLIRYRFVHLALKLIRKKPAAQVIRPAPIEVKVGVSASMEVRHGFAPDASLSLPLRTASSVA